MRYRHGDNVNIVDTNNELLSQSNSNEKLVLDFNNVMISISCIDKTTGIKTVLVNNINSDQSYAWLEGFKMGMILMNKEYD
jgi:hypothetical protein